MCDDRPPIFLVKRNFSIFSNSLMGWENEDSDWRWSYMKLLYSYSVLRMETAAILDDICLRQADQNLRGRLIRPHDIKMKSYQSKRVWDSKGTGTFLLNFCEIIMPLHMTHLRALPSVEEQLPYVLWHSYNIFSIKKGRYKISVFDDLESTQWERGTHSPWVFVNYM